MKKSIGKGANILPLPVLMIATYNEDGTVDVMNAAWGGIYDDYKVIVNLDPNHKSAKNIKERGAFTISLGEGKYVSESDYFGLVSANKDKKKFERSGFTAIKSDKVDAPIINEYSFALECKVDSPIEEKDTIHVIGEIIDTLVDDSVLDDKGGLDVKKLDALVFSTFDKNYYHLGSVAGKAFKVGVPLLKK